MDQVFAVGRRYKNTTRRGQLMGAHRHRCGLDTSHKTGVEHEIRIPPLFITLAPSPRRRFGGIILCKRSSESRAEMLLARKTTMHVPSKLGLEAISKAPRSRGRVHDHTTPHHITSLGRAGKHVARAPRLDQRLVIDFQPRSHACDSSLYARCSKPQATLKRALASHLLDSSTQCSMKCRIPLQTRCTTPPLTRATPPPPASSGDQWRGHV